MRDITRLCCRWVPLVHTFFFLRAGEATVVLEDVVALMGFSIHGTHSYDEVTVFEAMTFEDKELWANLIGCKDESRRERVKKDQMPKKGSGSKVSG